MILDAARTHSRLRVWIDELPDAPYESDRVWTDSWPADPLRMKQADRVGAELRVFIPHPKYGLLGMCYTPVPSATHLTATAHLSTRAAVEAAMQATLRDKHASEFTDMDRGLPKDLARGTIRGVRLAVAQGVAGTGHVQFARSVWGLGSSPLLSTWLATLLTRLVFDGPLPTADTLAAYAFEGQPTFLQLEDMIC